MSRSSHGSPGGCVVDVVGGVGEVLVVELVGDGGCVLEVVGGGGCVLEVVGGGGCVLDVGDVDVVDDVDAALVVLDDVDACVVAEVVLEPGRPAGAVVLVVDVVVERPGRGRVLDVVLVVGVGVSAGVGQLAGTGAARATKRPGSSWRTLPPK